MKKGWIFFLIVFRHSSLHVQEQKFWSYFLACGTMQLDSVLPILLSVNVILYFWSLLTGALKSQICLKAYISLVFYLNVENSLQEECIRFWSLCKFSGLKINVKNKKKWRIICKSNTLEAVTGDPQSLFLVSKILFSHSALRKVTALFRNQMKFYIMGESIWLSSVIFCSLLVVSIYFLSNNGQNLLKNLELLWIFMSIFVIWSDLNHDMLMPNFFFFLFY